jgi:hypothetical protein
MIEFKSCKNCLHIKNNKKIYCERGKFIKVQKERFFYDPYKPAAEEPVFLSKYEALAHAIICDHYDPVKRIYIKDVEFTDVQSDGSKYGHIEVHVEHVSIHKGFAKQNILRYTGVSPGAKIRKYFEKVKDVLDGSKKLCDERSQGHDMF